MTHRFKIDNDYLTELTHFDAVSGNKNTYLCDFDIKCDENGGIWFAVFKNSEGVYVTPIENGKCTIPYEILEKENVAYLGCYAECDGEKRISTNWVLINIGNGAYSDGTAPTPPEEELWERLLKNSVPVISENGNWFIYDMAEETYVDTGFTAKGDKVDKGDKGDTGEQGPKGDKGDKGDTGASGYTPQKGIDYFTEADLAEFTEPLDMAKRINMYGKDVTPTTENLSFDYYTSTDAYLVQVSAANKTVISGDIVIPYE